MRLNSLIIGVGAVGLGVASCIAASTDWPLTFLTRPGRDTALSYGGIKRKGIFGEAVTAPERIAVFDNPGKIPGGPFDLILVCTKTFDSEQAAEMIKQNPSLFSPETKIVLFHNGWGSADPFVDRFSSKQIFNARVITGFKRPDLNIVEVTVHADDIRIGSVFFPADSIALAPLADAISAGGIPAKVTEKVGCEIWSKMLYNCALNPLGAVLNATYGALGDSPDTRLIMNRVIDECFAVMKASGNATHWESPDSYREAFYGKMIPPTYVHESSMLQDIRAGRRTEIEFLSGAIVRLGQQFQIPTPTNQTLVDQVSFLESRAENWATP
jgi:2-dehydropantoate 2-reductase